MIMAKRRKKTLGNYPENNYHALAQNFMSSATNNFARIRERHSRADSCSLIEHYTDVVSEATVAEAVAYEAGDDVLAARARKLTSTATRAQRGAVAACRRGVKVH
jgi:hypothetical protein